MSMMEVQCLVVYQYFLLSEIRTDYILIGSRRQTKWRCEVCVFVCVVHACVLRDSVNEWGVWEKGAGHTARFVVVWSRAP